MNIISSFDSLLVPVDFSVNTDVAIKKGLELASPGSTIHLLHVLSSYSPFMGPSFYRFVLSARRPDNIELVEKKMAQWKKAIEESVPEVKVCTWLNSLDTIQSAIEKQAERLRVDIVIIGKRSHHSWFPFLNTVTPTGIVERTGIPVLTVGPAAMHSRVKTILIPVTDNTAIEKMKVVPALLKKFRARVLLVTFKSNGYSQGISTPGFIKVYQWLKTFMHWPVEHAVIQGNNRAKAIAKFAADIQADILLVHPEKETSIGWFNKNISDALPPASQVQVMAV